MINRWILRADLRGNGGDLMVMQKTSTWKMGIVLVIMFGMFGSLPLWAEYQVGEHVSDFTLQNWNGQWISLYDYSDRIVIIDFWFNG